VNGESERRDETVSEAPETEALDNTSKAAEEGAVPSTPPSDDEAGIEPTTESDAGGDPTASETEKPETEAASQPEVIEEASADEEELAASQTATEESDEPSEEEPSQDEGAEDEAAVVEPLEEIDIEEEEVAPREWYILKVQVNREESIRDALTRRVKIAGLEEHFGDIVVPTEDVAEFNKSGKRRIVKKKLYPGYIMVHMSLTDDTWFLVRETPGIGDFTGSAGKPTPMDPVEVKRIIHVEKDTETGEPQVKTAIPFKPGDRVRVKEGYFENFEGDVESIDEANGRVTVMINIFGRSTPVELEHWQIENV
jgi:transcriptional antiterminator NusG